jgi:hypothetical protein
MSGGDSTRLFVYDAPAGLSLRNLGLTNGDGGASDGGVVLNHGNPVVGGGVFSDNEAGAAYCGRAIATFGSLSITDSTRVRNQVGDGGAGGNCYLGSGSVPRIVSEGHQLCSDATCRPYLTRVSDRVHSDSRLAPLEENGGTTLTHLQKDRSPAINRGQCMAGVDIDQRGVSKPQDTRCDISAVEMLSDCFLHSYVPLVGRDFR